MKNRPETSPESTTGVEEDELILHFYGESADPATIERALATDAALARRYAELAAALGAATREAPEPPADLAARVWQELRPRLSAKRSWRERLFPAGADWAPRWSLAGAALAVVVALGVGYLAGRREPPVPATNAGKEAGTEAGMEAGKVAGHSSAARERLLLASVEGHLAGTERLLTRVTNAAPTDAEALAEEAAWAEALVSSNRLYRRAAERSGQRRIAALLDELEPLLLELSHSSEAAPDDLAAAQRRIEHTDLLFKLRVTGERLQRDAGASRSTTQTTTRTVS